MEVLNQLDLEEDMEEVVMEDMAAPVVVTNQLDQVMKEVLNHMVDTELVVMKDMAVLVLLAMVEKVRVMKEDMAAGQKDQVESGNFFQNIVKIFNLSLWFDMLLSLLLKNKFL